MSRLLRIIALEADLEDARRLRACLQALEDRRVSLQHLAQTQDAIGRLAKMRADALFIDEDLPRVTGVETIRALRAGGERRPIIGMAKVDCGYLAADLMRAGADGYLAKDDLNPSLVGRVLDRALHAARGRVANDQLRRSAVRKMIAEYGPAFAGLA